MNCNVRGNDDFYTTIPVFLEKNKMIVVCFLQESAPNKDVFFGLPTCTPQQLWSTRIFWLNCISAHTSLTEQTSLSVHNRVGLHLE